MALYEVRKVCEPDRRGNERERFELYRDGDYVTGIDIPTIVTESWTRIAPKQVKLNLRNRHGDDAPEFGASPGDPEAITFAGMLNHA